MHAYKFRVTSDENDEFLREIDVLANQTFEDFHKAMVSTCKFAGNELASFHLCDYQWRKRREITLMDMNVDIEEEEEKSEIALIMKDVKLNQIINDPHQKLIYVYDYLHFYTVNLELIKISQADLTLQFPMITKEFSDIIAPPTKLTKIVEEEEDVLDTDELKVDGLEEGGEEEENEDEQFFVDDTTDL